MFLEGLIVIARLGNKWRIKYPIVNFEKSYGFFFFCLKKSKEIKLVFLPDTHICVSNH
ncbi:unnamed protein product [Commensalibacter communis]|nr:unnamed protein product [Commensalibacter communis]CAI3961742.1 unnamed protein product [Commensalibacter communis]